MLDMWHDKEELLLSAVTATTDIAAYNVGGVTIHRLLQLPIEHEGRTAGYWRLGKDPLKVMRRSLSKLRFLIINEVSMLSNLNLVYVHIRLDEIFGRRVVWRCECIVCGGHPVTPTSKWGTCV